jgi:hypothetical protein
VSCWNLSTNGSIPNGSILNYGGQLMPLVDVSSIDGLAEGDSGWPAMGGPKHFNGALDCDFRNGLGVWSAISGSAGIVDLHETSTSTAKYDVTSFPGWLLMQSGNSQSVQLKVDYTLGDGESFIAAMHYPGLYTGDNGNIAIRLNDNDASSGSGNNVTAMIEQDSTEWVLQGNSSADTAGNEIASSVTFGGQATMLRISRVGTTYFMWSSVSGGTWQLLFTEATLTNLNNCWISFTGSSTSFSRIPIVACQWTKLGNNKWRPWD